VPKTLDEPNMVSKGRSPLTNIGVKVFCDPNPEAPKIV
jgi:hypothetical protein